MTPEEAVAELKTCLGYGNDELFTDAVDALEIEACAVIDAKSDVANVVERNKELESERLASRNEIFNLRSLVASLQDDLRDYHNVKACYAELSNASAAEIGKRNEQILQLEKQLNQAHGPRRGMVQG